MKSMYLYPKLQYTIGAIWFSMICWSPEYKLLHCLKWSANVYVQNYDNYFLSSLQYLMLTPKEFSEVRKIHIHYGREDNFSLHPGPSPSQSPTTTPPESSNGNEPAKPNLPCNDNSQPERTEEWAATNMASQTRPLVEYPAEQMCSGSKGLLLKIVEALKKETTGSTFR